MKIALLGIVSILMLSCSESSSPLIEAEIFAPNVSMEPSARAYLFDTLGAETVKIVVRDG